MRRRNIIALGFFAIFYVSFGIFVALNQEQIVYQPSYQDFYACTNFKSVKKVNHQGTRMYVHEVTKPVVILYHGNAGSACDRGLYARIFTQAGYGYVLVEYAGYSNDDKKPSHELIKQDVRNTIAYLEENDIQPTAFVGESIGTGVASYHASLAPPDKLLLISPFTDLADLANDHFWFYPTSLLVNNAFDNPANLNDYHGKVTIIHGTADRTVRYKFGKELFDSLSTEKHFVSITGASHNDLFLHEKTFNSIKSFFDK